MTGEVPAVQAVAAVTNVSLMLDSFPMPAAIDCLSSAWLAKIHGLAKNMGVSTDVSFSIES